MRGMLHCWRKSSKTKTKNRTQKPGSHFLRKKELAKLVVSLCLHFWRWRCIVLLSKRLHWAHTKNFVYLGRKSWRWVCRDNSFFDEVVDHWPNLDITSVWPSGPCFTIQLYHPSDFTIHLTQPSDTNQMNTMKWHRIFNCDSILTVNY